MAVKLQRRLLNVEEYYHMAEAGILTHKDRVELIRGELIRMSPISKGHAYIVDRLNHFLGKRLGDRAFIRVQNPLRIDQYSEPEPDLSILKPPLETYKERHPIPSDIILLIEVAKTSLDYDREIKLPLYAEAKIPVVWLVNLTKATIEVYQKPEKNAYSDLKVYEAEDVISIPGFEDKLLVNDLLDID